MPCLFLLEVLTFRKHRIRNFKTTLSSHAFTRLYTDQYFIWSALDSVLSYFYYGTTMLLSPQKYFQKHDDIILLLGTETGSPSK